MWAPIQRFYERQVAKRSWLWVIGICSVLMFFGWQARHFTLDASAESLLLEHDDSLSLFREVSERYGTHGFLFLTFTPESSLFSDTSLKVISELRDELRSVEHVESVVSILDVPLLANPPVPMTELVANIKTLEDPETDIALAKKELANSPLYVNLLLNVSENTTALQINLPKDETKHELLKQRDDLQQQIQLAPDSDAQAQLSEIEKLILQHNRETSVLLHQMIVSVRDIMSKYQDKGELHLGGVPMIADDLISYVRNDLIVFGLAVFVVIIVTLSVIFRQRRWVVLPLFISLSVVVVMTGLLGLLNWPVTVISSNFISLLLILTLSMNIHLVVRYRELLSLHPDWDQSELVVQTVRNIVVPCVYMTLTTGVAFLSLIFSGIRPVIDFGWIMTIGVGVAFIMTFMLLPTMLMIIGRGGAVDVRRGTGWFTQLLAKFTLRNGRLIMITSVAVAVFTVIGMSQLVVENSFINYFDKKTEIYQGMTVIDQKLGGTTPLDVLISFDRKNSLPEQEKTVAVEDSESESSDDGFVDDDFLAMDDDVGSFESDFAGEDDPAKYWFTTDKVSDIERIHQYLDELPETGKVISLATMIEIAEDLNGGVPLTNVELALLYSLIPKEFRAIVLDPYVSVDHNEARINVRIIDSMPGLKRNALIKQIERDMVDELGFEPGQVQLTGLLVLYNNMLQSLFSSQIMTLGGVFAGIMLMFLALFRNLKLAIIAMVPNLLAAMLVLGVMGWLGIPLDIMTITIASITIGIAVDNTIHYVVRYRIEYEREKNYVKALRYSHASIGKAIFYTSMTIVMGFSILALSNFKPSIYFGLLTALAMAVALLGSLTLLPRLILWWKPFGQEQKNA